MSSRSFGRLFVRHGFLHVWLVFVAEVLWLARVDNIRVRFLTCGRVSFSEKLFAAWIFSVSGLARFGSVCSLSVLDNAHGRTFIVEVPRSWGISWQCRTLHTWDGLDGARVGSSSAVVDVLSGALDLGQFVVAPPTPLSPSLSHLPVWPSPRPCWPPQRSVQQSWSVGQAGLCSGERGSSARGRGAGLDECFLSRLGSLGTQRSGRDEVGNRAEGLPLHGRLQLAVDTTLVGAPLGRDGQTWCGAHRWSSTCGGSAPQGKSLSRVGGPSKSKRLARLAVGGQR